MEEGFLRVCVTDEVRERADRWEKKGDGEIISSSSSHRCDNQGDRMKLMIDYDKTCWWSRCQEGVAPDMNQKWLRTGPR